MWLSLIVPCVVPSVVICQAAGWTEGPGGRSTDSVISSPLPLADKMAYQSWFGRAFLLAGAVAVVIPSGLAFQPLPARIALTHTRCLRPVCSTVADSATTSNVALEKDVLKSEVGMDYVPLANMLLTGDFEAADQFTRDALIKLAGPGAQKRGYVYFTEVPRLPETDMATIEKLWLKYSKGKFGYTVQRSVWNSATVQGDFEKFCRKIGWNIMENGVERKLRWFGKSEFIYDLEKAPTGHLPLTSALRGTSLLKGLLSYPLWQKEWDKTL